MTQTDTRTRGARPQSPATPIFVFGSNLAGRHGKGAALWARQHRGAVYGVGVGRTGDSYAIPTKDGRFVILVLRMDNGRPPDSGSDDDGAVV